jgi:hypothetical protein
MAKAIAFAAQARAISRTDFGSLMRRASWA